MKITSYKTGILSYPITKTPNRNVYNLFNEDLEYFCWTCISVPYVLHTDECELQRIDQNMKKYNFARSERM